MDTEIARYELKESKTGGLQNIGKEEGGVLDWKWAEYWLVSRLLCLVLEQRWAK